MADRRYRNALTLIAMVFLVLCLPRLSWATGFAGPGFFISNARCADILTPVTGKSLCWDTVNQTLYQWNGTAWGAWTGNFTTMNSDTANVTTGNVTNANISSYSLVPAPPNPCYVGGIDNDPLGATQRELTLCGNGVNVVTTLGFGSPSGRNAHRTFYFIQPATGTPDTWSLAVTGTSKFYCLGSACPDSVADFPATACHSNTCIDQVDVDYLASIDTYVERNTALGATVSTAGGGGCGAVAGSQNYYVDIAAGNDANAGTSTGAAWQHLSKVRSFATSPKFNPGDAILLKSGGTWTEMFDASGISGTAAKPITFCSYGGTTLPILDEQGVNNFCVFYSPIYGGSSPVAYQTWNGWECKHAKESGWHFDVGGGVTAKGITVTNWNIHNTGAGCYSTNGQCTTGFDDGLYMNQLDFQDSNVGSDGVQFINNTVNNGGGHNLVQVHYDTGAVLVKGNTVGPGGAHGHGFVDVKGVGSLATPALITQNIVKGGAAAGVDNGPPAFYEEDTADVSYVTWSFNLVYDHLNAMFQFCPGLCQAGRTCNMIGKFYNNTLYAFNSSTTQIYATTGCNSNAPYSLRPSLDVRNNIFDGGNYIWGSGFTCTENYNNIGGAQHWSNNGGGTLQICGGTGTGTLGVNDQINVNPLFISVPDNNFQLQGTSPEINAGQSGVTTSKNIGAY